MKVSDWICEFLRSKVGHVFGVQGGAVTHLFDSCGRYGPKPVFHHHEQAAAFAAFGYSVVRGYGVCISTTGPGSTNTLTGLLAGWQCSQPMMFISGQARADQTSYGRPVRQTGTQEYPIVAMTSQASKAAYFVKDAGAVKAVFERAYAQSVGGRPGPVWIDLPVNVSWEQMP